MKLTVRAGGVPGGNYNAKFAGVEPFNNGNEYGEGLLWKWEITGGGWCPLSIVSFSVFPIIPMMIRKVSVNTFFAESCFHG